MSEAIVLNAELRKDVGKGASRRLRHAKKVPAIIYGGEIAPVQITLEQRVVKKALEAEAFYSQVITLEVDGEKEQTILKDLQRHPAKEFAMHMDFLRVDSTHAITTSVPLHFINEEGSVGVKAGGVINHNINEVEIRCLPQDLPEFIEVDVSAVEVGSSVHLSDLNISDKVTLVQLALGESHDLPVVGIHMPRGVAEEESEEEAGGEEE